MAMGDDTKQKPEPPPESDDYDASDDFTRSIEDCYAAIRERKANGGKGWTPP
jgi:hypothetical protein